MTDLLISISNNLFEYMVKGADLSKLGWIELYKSVQHGKDPSTYEPLNTEIERLKHALSESEAKCKELEEENKRLNECIDNAKAEIEELATDGDYTSFELLKQDKPYKAGQRAAYNHALDIIVINELQKGNTTDE